MGYMTEKQRMDVLKDIVVVVDSREKSNQHILDYFNKENVKYQTEKLDTADYTVIFPNYPELDLDEKVLIEKKNSLTELSGNFTKHRERFKRQFERIEPKQQMHVVVETATWRKLFNGRYRSEFHPNSYKASIFTWNKKYGVPFWFCEKLESPEIIYKLMYYDIYERLKKL